MIMVDDGRCENGKNMIGTTGMARWLESQTFGAASADLGFL